MAAEVRRREEQVQTKEADMHFDLTISSNVLLVNAIDKQILTGKG